VGAENNEVKEMTGVCDNESCPRGKAKGQLKVTYVPADAKGQKDQVHFCCWKCWRIWDNRHNPKG
jgi:hypothetical protein